MKSEVRSRFCDVNAIASIFPKVRSPILCQWMRSRLSSRRCDHVYLSQAAIAFLCGGCDRVYLSQGAIAFPYQVCDRLSLSVNVIASILSKVRSRLSFLSAITLHRNQALNSSNSNTSNPGKDGKRASFVRNKEAPPLIAVAI